MKVSAADMIALRDVAGKLGVPPGWLYALINFETAGTWDPAIKNPRSSARGLIQFLDATAANLGYRDSLDLVTKHATIESQLRGPVLAYLKPFGPFNSEQEFYFSVFLPKYRRASLDTVIYANDPERQAKFRAANPGVLTVGDYYNKLRAAFSRVSGGKLPGAAVGGGFAVLTMAVIASIFFLRG